jgi:hypothetical protein
MRRITRTTGFSTPRSTRSSRRKKAKKPPDKSPSGEYNTWKYAALRPGTSSSHIVYSSQVMVMSHSFPQSEKELQQQRRASCPRRGMTSLKSLIKKRGLAIRLGEKLHLSKSSSSRSKKGPTASIITSTARIATRIYDTAGIWYPEPMEGRYEPPVYKTYTIPNFSRTWNAKRNTPYRKTGLNSKWQWCGITHQHWNHSSPAEEPVRWSLTGSHLPQHVDALKIFTPLLLS